jgi:MFS transporter, DHA2 family, multidrug resistance protein
MFRNKWSTLAVISAALFLIGIDMTVLYTALPTLTRELDATNSGKLWIINTYPLVMAGLLPGLGTLGDRFGHRLVFMGGLSFFGIASLLAAFSPCVSLLIGSRALLAIGAAMMMPASLALIRQTFVTDHERAIAIGIWGSVYSGAAAIGPLICGFLLGHFWWGSVFLINVPVVLFAVILVPIVIKRQPGTPDRPWDLRNSALVMVGLVGLTYGLKEIAKPDADAAHAATALVIGLIFMTWFVHRQARSSSPLIDFTLFRNPRFLAGVSTIIVAMVTFMGVQLVMTQRLQLVEGFSPLEAGLFIVPMSLASFFAGPMFGSVLHRIGIAPALWLALLINGTGLVGLAVFDPSALWLQVGSLVLFGFGGGAAASTSSTAIMVNAPEEKAGMAGSIEAVSYELGGVLGVAIMGSVATYVYATNLALPVGLPDALLARDSLDQALIYAGGLKSDQAPAVIEAAKAAFDTSSVWVLWTGVLIIAILGLGLTVLFKTRTTHSEPGQSFV